VLSRGPAPDDGSVLVLIIGYTAIAAVLIVVGVDVSAVFLAQRTLASSADSAALSAAQGVDITAVYDGPGLRCAHDLPLDPTRAEQLAAASVAGDRADLGRSFTSLADRTEVIGGTVSVTLSGSVAVPFGKVLSWLDPADRDGTVSMTASATARSPVTGGDC
jgi:uncharacterized membrane protein